MRVNTSMAQATTYIIVVLLSCLVGLTIVRVVDWRLRDISINMPAITLPKQHVYIKLSQTELDSKAYVGEPLEFALSEASVTHLEKQLGGSVPNDERPLCQSSDMVCAKDKPEQRTRFVSKRYKSEEYPLKNTYVTPEPTGDHHERPAPYPRTEPLGEPSRDTKSSSANFYLHPNEMSPEQLVRFQQKAKLEKMTLKDYENWLWTFQRTPEQLQGFHRGNLRILTHGGQLTEGDMPQVSKTPPTAQQDYMRMIQAGVTDNIPQPEWLGYKPKNYEEQVGHPSEELSLRHLAFVNPDEPMKTWILTRPGALEAQTPGKSEALKK